MQDLEIWDETVKKGIFDEDFKYPNPLNGRAWSPTFKKLFNEKIKPLASYKKAKGIFDVMKNNQVVLLTMGTGAGKTVMMPKIMLHYFAYKKKLQLQYLEEVLHKVQLNSEL